jgi:hypothetical protein
MQNEITQPQGNYTTSRPPLPGDLAEVTSREPSLIAILSALRMPNEPISYLFAKKMQNLSRHNPQATSKRHSEADLRQLGAIYVLKLAALPERRSRYDANLQHECEKFFPSG